CTLSLTTIITTSNTTSDRRYSTHLLLICLLLFFFFFFNDPPTTEIYTLSLHDALPICSSALLAIGTLASTIWRNLRSLRQIVDRSEEHTSELQSRFDLVCRLLLEKKKNIRVTVWSD